MVHTVSSPVRKFARVGRPASRVASMRAHVRQSQDRVAAVLHRRPEFSSRLRELPRVGGADVDEEVECPGERARPIRDRLRTAEPAQRDVEPVDEFGQAAR